MIVSQAPFRVSLLGGGSDFPEHFIENGGAVFGGSINRYCFVSVRPRPQSFGTNFRIRYSQVDEGNHPHDISHPAVRYLLDHFEIAYPLDLNHSSDLPARSGIGSSSAFLAATYAGLSPKALINQSSFEIASKLSDIERNGLSEICGLQDTIFTVFGGVNLIEFSSDGFNIHQSRASRSYLSDLADHCFLIYLGNERVSSVQQVDLVNNMDRSAQLLNELAVAAREAFAQVDREQMAPSDLGQWLQHGWELKKSSSPTATTKEADELNDELIRLGAWGGKLLGAGGGGFFLAIASRGVRRRFEELHPDQLTCSFSWEYEGLTIRSV